MGYNIRDLIEKALMLAEKRREMYRAMAEGHADLQFAMVARTLMRQATRDIEKYRLMLGSLREEELDMIPFDVFDKISSLVNQFQRRVIVPDVKTTSDLMNFSLGLEESIYALYIDIQGRLVSDDKVVSTKAYMVLNQLIQEKEKNIEDLRGFVN